MTASGTAPALDEMESYRRELTGYCYRMLGSGSEAEDAVQETLLRAWRAAEGFEGRSSLRSWLYRIATNVCLDMHRGVQRRARPMELGPSSPPREEFLGEMLPEDRWISPIPDARVVAADADPAEVAATRDTIRLAFVTALQHLPPKQRAALILCEVLRWQATEAAELLETSVAAVNSALQRARATLADLPVDRRPDEVDADRADLLARYVEAFERYDIERLVTLLHEDAIMSMPPFDMWIEGADNIGRFMLEPGPSACRGSRLVATWANGSPAFAQYKPDPAGGFSAWGLQVLEIVGPRIAGYHCFLDSANIFPVFGLPLHLDQ
ncbi:MAG TPA: sigma-70 family RNA polymerase sigma factor [Acidimicrobiales bacterium]|nr:sigma-70 family RNA polymerase sigma factor [Acidimicrobiales bacterium]